MNELDNRREPVRMTFKDTFFIPFYSPVYAIDNPAEELLRSLGGTLETHRAFHGWNRDERYSQQFELWFSEYSFKTEYLTEHAVRAFVSGEMYAKPAPQAETLTGMLMKVRLGNFDMGDEFTLELSDKLGELEERQARRYPSEEIRHIIWSAI